MSDVSVSNMTFLSPKQVADMLGVSKATVSRWAAQDATFPATRLPGRLVRIEEQALHRWLRRKAGRKASQVPDSLTPAPDQQSGVCASEGATGPAFQPETGWYTPKLKAPRVKAECAPAIVQIFQNSLTAEERHDEGLSHDSARHLPRRRQAPARL